MAYDTLADKAAVEKTVASLKANHFDAIVLDTGAQALGKIKELIPKGASVMNGASKTLEKIGYLSYLESGAHGWNNLKAAILAEKDPLKQAELRKQSVISDYYVGSAHALTEDGTILVASNTGSQLPHLAFTSPNVILVVSTKKITRDIADAWGRIERHVIPREDERMKEAYGYGTTHAKTLILHRENPSLGRKVLVILVGEDLGF
ncbi:MAG TPA: lactate utilization protein [Candidatus Paceibacterota bacterium]|nr:lactate utilization protein [Candidatus Paceibacterota bacterium]